MSTAAYDAVVVGAGSVGMPAAVALAEKGLKILVVDQFSSPGQGSNKAAIGGIRATHSTPAKVRLCLDSIRVFSTWKETHGDDLEWYQGGYVFVAYRDEEATMLKRLLSTQQSLGLDIRWLGREQMRDLLPNLHDEGLMGGTYSPGDGSASPLLSCAAFHARARRLGVQFRFGERVTGIIRRRSRVAGVRTDKGGFACPWVVNAAGPWARAVAQGAGLDVPVVPDSHEAGITEPVARFLEPMVVDLRPAEGSRNYYFYQHRPGGVVFCITPDPAVVGTDRRETSAYLPTIARRMVGLMPQLANLKVRRTWRGLYPMTPDGSPCVGASRTLEGYVNAVGMCGQGYMLGPGVGSLVARIVTDTLEPGEASILEELRPERRFEGQETLE